ncbi:hypothetical protein BDA96_03G359400 [Sorghum bicolor]|uniref:Uncharacterized protein n=2 Tax=Sorghum bicolor TaxID=4558 RepID=A0A921RHH7_SORBI|nr:hypothetical protein BDA96_03G359400 [Sorghum bicolor]OQU87744.1 hypothetical protein SORBI_3003G333150 [Sorghum bicolor]
MKTAAICKLSITNPPLEKNPHIRNAQCHTKHTHLCQQEPFDNPTSKCFLPRIPKPAAKNPPQPRALTNHRSCGPAGTAVTTTSPTTGQENQLQEQTPGRGPWNPARGRRRPGNAWPSGPSFRGFFKPRERTTVARRRIL